MCRSVRYASSTSSPGGYRKLAFAYAGITEWRALGDYWLEEVLPVRRSVA